MDMQQLKNNIIKELMEKIPRVWLHTELVFQFPPTANKSYVVMPSFYDEKNQSIRIFFPSNSNIDEALYRFIFDANKAENINELKFEMKRNDETSARITMRFNQDLANTFDHYIFADNKQKMEPWWRRPSPLWYFKS